MLDGLKGMGAMAGLLKDLPRLKAQMEQVKERLGDVTVQAETGGGAVRVVADGHGRVRGVEIDAALMAGLVGPDGDDDRVLAQELIVGAVNAALDRAREAARAEIASAAGELGLPLPPGALEGLLG
ncbi:MAG: YbaB/EbfC family nucleoid-associated protein [Planctomycetota bacterium]|jgi:DNA-binding protein YbaB